MFTVRVFDQKCILKHRKNTYRNSNRKRDFDPFPHLSFLLGVGYVSTCLDGLLFGNTCPDLLDRFFLHNLDWFVKAWDGHYRAKLLRPTGGDNALTITGKPREGEPTCCCELKRIDDKERRGLNCDGGEG